MSNQDVATTVHELAQQFEEELLQFQRDLHAHPELSRQEVRTTAKVAERLRAAGLQPRLLEGTGLLCDIGQGEGRVGLRADLDALPLQETTGLPWESEVPGVAHSCGHDVHTTVVLGAGLVLAQLAAEGKLARPVRLIFQPAEEVQPGGALDLIAQEALQGVSEIYALHCDPKIEVGAVGTRIGPITSASDEVEVTITSSGGHTSRPHMTGDVVFALGQVITQVPAILGRRLDPRSGVNLTWGSVRAGQTHNAIPDSGVVWGTLRCLDAGAWAQAATVMDSAIHEVVSPYGVAVELRHIRGVPPVINDEECTRRLDIAVREVLGEEQLVLTEQSLGGEDFAWYTQHVPGAMARLGVRSVGSEIFDIHQPDFVADPKAVMVGTQILARVALRA